MGRTKPDATAALAAVQAYLGRVVALQRACRIEGRKVTDAEKADVARLRAEWARAYHGDGKGKAIKTTHEVQVWNHKGSWRTRWYACEVIGRHPAPRSFVAAEHAGEWLDVRLADGTVYECCNPDCVRAKNNG